MSLDNMIPLYQNHFSLDPAAKSTKQRSLQPALRLRPTCAGITFEERVALFMREIWKSVIGFEGLYEVSNLGQVRAMYDGNHGQHKPRRILKPCRTPNNYFIVSLYRPGTKQKGKKKSVHCIVLEAFKGPRPLGNCSRHKDGNRSNNTTRNLRWGTYKQNYDDSRKHQTNCEGERNGFSILTACQVREMRKLRKQGLTYHALGRRFKTHWSNASLIIRGRTWKNA